MLIALSRLFLCHGQVPGSWISEAGLSGDGPWALGVWERRGRYALTCLEMCEYTQRPTHQQYGSEGYSQAGEGYPVTSPFSDIPTFNHRVGGSGVDCKRYGRFLFVSAALF